VDDATRLDRIAAALAGTAPRVVATDLDGTLLRTDGMPSARTVAAIDAVERAGIDVILVTARPPRWLDGLAGIAGEHGIAVCGNGAFVYDVVRREVLKVRPLPPEDVAELVRDLRAAIPGMVFGAERASGPSFEASFPSAPAGVPLGRHHVGPMASWDDEPIGKLLGVQPDWDGEVFLDRVTEVVGDRAHVAYSGAEGLAEITAWGVTKAHGLQRWCEERAIASQEVWAFGDMPNDVSMLQWAGESFAVANAHDEVLAAARHTCASNDADGVAQVLEWLAATQTASRGG
jgi:hydroxymethylpyrimidine pyrophosphatase-like HAD family hydrolase